jgi:hypothetical protein
MRILNASLLTFLCLLSTSGFAQSRTSSNSQLFPTASVTFDPQTGYNVLCKGVQVPEGYALAGETLSKRCQGTAWIVKRKARRQPVLDPVSWRRDESVSVAEPKEVLNAALCDTFQKTIRNTYNFNPARLNEAQVKAESAKLDVFWSQVRASRAGLVPCLREALREDTSGGFFAIDGSMLLVDQDPSRASKALQVRKFIEANLDGTDLEYWVNTMARRGVEGFDTSGAGAKWLLYPKAKYNLSLHGGFPVDSFLGALFIFGSMDEDLATPVLLRIANQLGHPHRDDALAILMSQATPASLHALKQVNPAGFTPGMGQSIRELLENPKLLKARAHPKLTREEQMIAFQGIVDGDYTAFREMVMKAPDGEVDAVATLLPEDIPLVRRARRASISRCNQHALSDYASFTKILWALTWKSESGK